VGFLAGVFRWVYPKKPTGTGLLVMAYVQLNAVKVFLDTFTSQSQGWHIYTHTTAIC